MKPSELPADAVIKDENEGHFFKESDNTWVEMFAYNDPVKVHDEGYSDQGLG